MEIKIAELKQRHVEAFIKEMPVGKDLAETPLAIYWGQVVRAACKAGWYLEPVFKAEEVDEMNPRDVKELFTATIQRYAEIMDVPPS